MPQKLQVGAPIPQGARVGMAIPQGATVGDPTQRAAEPLDREGVARTLGESPKPIDKLIGWFRRVKQEAQERQLRDAAQGTTATRLAYPGEGRTMGLDPTELFSGMGEDASKFLKGATSVKNLAVTGAALAAPEVVLPILGGMGAAEAFTPRRSDETQPEAVQRRLFGVAQVTGAAAGTRMATRGGLRETNTAQALSGARRQMQTMFGRRLTPQQAGQVPARAAFQEALRNTPQEVIAHAAREGIDLTPSQATGSRLQGAVQAAGERSIAGGERLSQAIDKNRGAFSESVKRFEDRIDPQRVGLSDEAAGAHLQESVKVALEVAKENANAAYAQAGIDQVNLAGSVTRLKTFADSKLYVRQPGAAVARPEYQSASVRRALTDIASAPRKLGNRPSVQSMRNLRTEFWEKANDYSGNIPDAARGLYKQASAMVDDAIMDAARGTPFEASFRAANQQWRDLQAAFNERGKPLYGLQQAADPKAALRQILNRKSAADIEALRQAGFDLGPVQRRVVDDIARSGFRLSRNGLGDYSHSFLHQLFGPALKELYLKADIGRRLGYEVNPSGTSNVLLAEGQLSRPWRLLPLGAAAKSSMPRGAGEFLPPTSPVQPMNWRPGLFSLSRDQRDRGR